MSVIEQNNRKRYQEKFNSLSTADQKTIFDLMNISGAVKKLEANKETLMQFL